MSELRAIVIQMKICQEKGSNISHTAELIEQALKPFLEVDGRDARKPSDFPTLVILPEFFNSPYDFPVIPENAEQIPGMTSDSIADIARKSEIYVVAGSVPERCGDLIYNTCAVFNTEGTVIAKHRKMHMFDADLPGKRYCESDIFASGSSFTSFTIGNWKIGLGVCHDLRFPEMATAYALQGCHLIIYPSAFEMITGEAHWKLALQARALDNQLYVIGAAPARHDGTAYPVWGHSTIISPWASVLAEADEHERILTQILDLDTVENARVQIPLLKQRRKDCYRTADP